MIDLEKLRNYASGKNLYVTIASSEALELLDHIAQLEKENVALQRDTGRLDWIEKNGDVRIQRVRAGFNGPIRWDVEYGPYDDEVRSNKDMRSAIDTAKRTAAATAEANHGWKKGT